MNIFLVIFCNILSRALAVELITYGKNFNWTLAYYSTFFDEKNFSEFVNGAHLFLDDSYAYTSLNNKTFYYQWTHWGACYECGEHSVKNRTGECRVRNASHADLSCDDYRTKYKHLIVFYNLTSLSNCYEDCNDEYDLRGNVS